MQIFLDGRAAFSLKPEVAQAAGLQPGRELSDADIEALAQADVAHRCLSAALRYLDYRPRSAAELRQRLRRRGFSADTVEPALQRLREQGLLDDLAFARFWSENREAFSPRSRRLTGLELRRKGIAEEIIKEVTAGVADEDSAYRAARQRARTLKGCNYQSFSRRLGGYLRRRGFSYQVAKQTIERLWPEIGEDANKGA